MVCLSNIRRRDPTHPVVRVGQSPSFILGEVRDKYRGAGRDGRILEVVKGESLPWLAETGEMGSISGKFPEVGVGDGDRPEPGIRVGFQAGIAGQFFYPFLGMLFLIFSIPQILTISFDPG